jgi:hypothetical protein
MPTFTVYVGAVLTAMLLAPAVLILTVGLALRVLGVPRHRVASWALRMAGRCAEHGVLRGAVRLPTHVRRRPAVVLPTPAAGAAGAPPQSERPAPSRP